MQIPASSTGAAWARALGAILLLGTAVSFVAVNWPLRPHACSINASSRLIVSPIAGVVQERDQHLVVENAALQMQLGADLEQLKAQVSVADDELNRTRREFEVTSKALATAHSGAEQYLGHWRAYLEKARAEVVAQRDSASVELERAKRQVARGSKLVESRNITDTELDQFKANVRSADLRRQQFDAEVEKFNALLAAVEQGHIVDREAPLWQAFEAQLDLRLETLASATLPYLQSQSPHREKPLRAAELAIESKCHADMGVPGSSARFLVKPGQHVSAGTTLYEEPLPYSQESPYVLTAVFSDRAHPRVGDRLDVAIVGWHGPPPTATILEIRPPTRAVSHGFFDQLEVRQDQVLVIGSLEFANQAVGPHLKSGTPSEGDGWESRELIGRHARLHRPWRNGQNNLALFGVGVFGMLCVVVPWSRNARTTQLSN